MRIALWALAGSQVFSLACVGVLLYCVSNLSKAALLQDGQIRMLMSFHADQRDGITRRPCLICLAKTSEDGSCTQWEGHTVDEQWRVWHERDEMENRGRR